MRQKKAITLIELLVAISLLSVLVVAILSIGNSFYSLKRSMFSVDEPIIQANLALANIFERVLRAAREASTITNLTNNTTNATETPAYTIYEDGRRIEFRKWTQAGIMREAFWFDNTDQTVKYTYSTGGNYYDKVILSNVLGLHFKQAFGNRLAVEITIGNETFNHTVRGCVQPRNEFTAQSYIN